MQKSRWRAVVLVSIISAAGVFAAGGAATATPLDEPSSTRTSEESTAAPSAPLPFTAAAAGTASYYPTGPQVNVDLAALEGWELCYTDLYETADVDLYGPGGLLDELCTGDYLLLGGGPVSTDVLTVLAAAPRSDALFVTPADNTTVHVANGSGWYFNDDWSWGFVRAGDVPDKDECDVSTDGANDQKLCWHVFSQQLTFGYRAGAEQDLNDSVDYARYIYHAAEIAPAAENPQLADTGTRIDTPAMSGAILGAVLMGVGALVLARRRPQRR